MIRVVAQRNTRPLAASGARPRGATRTRSRVTTGARSQHQKGGVVRRPGYPRSQLSSRSRGPRGRRRFR